MDKALEALVKLRETYRMELRQHNNKANGHAMSFVHTLEEDYRRKALVEHARYDEQRQFLRCIDEDILNLLPREKRLELENSHGLNRHKKQVVKENQ